jgi:hypothetical protein
VNSASSPQTHYTSGKTLDGVRDSDKREINPKYDGKDDDQEDEPTDKSDEY